MPRSKAREALVKEDAVKFSHGGFLFLIWFGSEVFLALWGIGFSESTAWLVMQRSEQRKLTMLIVRRQVSSCLIVLLYKQGIMRSTSHNEEY